MSNLFSLQDDNDGFGLSGDDLFNVVSGGDDPFLDELGSPPLTTFTDPMQDGLLALGHRSPPPIVREMSGQLPAVEPPQTENNQVDAAEVIPTIAANRDTQFAAISDLVNKQRIAIQNSNANELEEISTLEEQLLKNVTEQLNALMALDQCVIISPDQMAQWQFLSRDLALQHQQLQLLQDELRAVSAGQACGALMALVIQNQPFPSIVSKGRQLTDNDCLTVQLLCASTASTVAEISNVSATLIPHSQSAPAPSSTSIVGGVVPSPLTVPVIEQRQQSSGKPTPEFLSENIVSFDTDTLTAKFALKFAVGTRKSLASVRCAVHVRATDGTTVLCESDSSAAAVVITNDSQWGSAAGALLQYELFGQQLQVRWPAFVNALQRCFLSACKASVRRDGNARLLSALDIDYIRVKFFDKADVVNAAQFGEFWKWFGPTLATLRFQRPVGALWHHGLLYGLLRRDDVEQALSTQPAGVFVLRFSETNAGQIGVAYVGSEGRVRHYLITAQDIAGIKRTVCDFLSEQPQFSTLLQYTTDAQGAPTFIAVPKHQVFKDFVHDTKPLQNHPEGYEPLA